MKRSLLGCLILFVAAMATADDSKDAAIKKDHQQIAGKWQVVAVEIDGQKLSDDDARKYSVYELGEKTRKLCIGGPDKPRPTDFSAMAGSEQILVTFERVAIK